VQFLVLQISFSIIIIIIIIIITIIISSVSISITLSISTLLEEPITYAQILFTLILREQRQRVEIIAMLLVLALQT
jgi:hypothetical protein